MKSLALAGAKVFEDVVSKKSVDFNYAVKLLEYLIVIISWRLELEKVYAARDKFALATLKDTADDVIASLDQVIASFRRHGSNAINLTGWKPYSGVSGQPSRLIWK